MEIWQKLIYSLAVLQVLSFARDSGAGPFPDQGATPDGAVAWATTVIDANSHSPAENILGPVDSNLAVGIAGGGSLTVGFDSIIINGPGPDFAVWENGFAVGNLIYAELAYVDVSTDGENWVTFPSVFLDEPEPTNPKINPTNVYNLAGNYIANYIPLGDRQGTPFDLDNILDTSAVKTGLVDPNHINYVRLRDIVGAQDGGVNYDHAVYFGYPDNHRIYDGLSYGGGADWDAVGVINTLSADFDKSGTVDLVDLQILSDAWLSQNGDTRWKAQCDISLPKDDVINQKDFAVFAQQWLKP